MDDKLSSPTGADYIKIHPTALAPNGWFKSWKGEMQDRLITLNRLLFGYQKDPGRVGAVRVLTPLKVQLSNSCQIPKKTFSHETNPG